ncbi:MAG TPA: serine hydrolase [Phenylobacterium sp.]|jgi:CubicO group peptidase (beta-lactamase class C family)|uniref:serine hydrolase domain-containing protein n=1 Tax=Phenylobacterium sp. TaxID=1871053 RepID=UPI002D5279C0|nr:serine hydrolase [Phenylobacterium sp.]HZZ69007.1 serine hydrolase [Phenylobacterium sp.]
MSQHPSRRTVFAGTAALGALAHPLAAAAQSAAMQAVLDYAGSQKTTGFLIVQNRKILAEKNWPAPADRQFQAFTYGNNPQGALLEDVASQQKSFVSMLAAVAVDKGLLDVAKPVSAYIGAGWCKATPEQEAKIRVIDVLTMSSGLTEGFAYAAPPATVFLYNTPVYAITKRIVAAVAKQPLEAITHDWLTAPAGMSDTSWRQRPAAFAKVGNPTGLVTSPRDTAKFGQIVLDGGKAADGKRIVSQAGLKAMFQRSATNPAYGRLWWLNGSAYAIKPLANRVDGPLVPAAPADMVAALGALDRTLFIVPSKKLIVVRMGAATPDKDFSQQLWLRLAKAVG